MATTKSPTHILQNEETLAAIMTRIKRAQGQLGGIVKMLEEGRSCDEIVTQMSAVSKAVHTAAFTLISASLEECIIEVQFQGHLDASDRGAELMTDIKK